MTAGRRFLLSIAIFAALLSVAAAIVVVQNRRRIPWVVSRVAFEMYLRRDTNEMEKQSRAGESTVYYFTSYYLNGLLSAAEATHSERLMKRALHYLDNMVDTAVSVTYKQKEYRVWGPFDVTPGSAVRKPNVHATLQSAVALARAAALIKRDPAFHGYSDHAQRYVSFVDDAVIQYWYTAQYDQHVPWLETDPPSIWNENSTNMGLCAAFLFEATENPLYGDIAKKVANGFQAKLSQAERGWIWESNTIPIGSDADNTPGSVGNQAGVPDTARTNREAMMMVVLHEAGLGFSREDLQRLGYTFTDFIWNQSLDQPAFANYITGSDKPYRVYKQPGLNGAIYHGWAWVGGYSPEAQTVLYRTLKAVLKGKRNSSLERNTTGYGGMLSLTGNLLRNFAINRQAE